tara:strand:- start:1791 stop:2048 length:258 start_codon:yes stop_codon:yes gene_type:complete
MALNKCMLLDWFSAAAPNQPQVRALPNKYSNWFLSKNELDSMSVLMALLNLCWSSSAAQLGTYVTANQLSLFVKVEQGYCGYKLI